MTIRVLVVDDSNLARRIIKQELEKDPEIRVVGMAMDPLEASEKIEELNPDVLTLDLEMPKMDGLTFLKSLMRHHPIPVVVVSAYTTRGSKLALEALESGALDIVPKPGASFSVEEMSAELNAKVKAASQAKFANGDQHSRPGRSQSPAAPRPPGSAFKPAPPASGTSTSRNILHKGLPENAGVVLPRIQRVIPAGRVIAIGSSTGGTQALQYIISRLPDNMPPILIVQHMPPGFTKTFADRLNQISALSVKEAEPNDPVTTGTVLVAPGAMHMVLNGNPRRYWVDITDGEKVCRQKPSVEVLFESVSRVAGNLAVGTILTGMGNDGADGMALMKKTGAINIAQDEQSCIVFGMPKEAIKKGGVDHVVPLHKIPEMLMKLI